MNGANEHIGLFINCNVKRLTMGIRRLVHELPEQSLRSPRARR